MFFISGKNANFHAIKFIGEVKKCRRMKNNSKGERILYKKGFKPK
jgi:hypothetical protein